MDPLHQHHQNPTLLFVHGAGCLPIYWQKIVPLLSSRNFRCITPDLPFKGTPNPSTSLDTSISLLQEIISTETTSGHNIILINHSFGGAVGASAVQGFTSPAPPTRTGRVLGLIHITATLNPPQTSFRGLEAISTYSIPFHTPDLTTGWEGLSPGYDPIALLFNDLPPTEVEYWLMNSQAPQSSACLSDSGSIYAGWLDVPVWFLYAKEDQCLPVAFQEEMVAKARGAGADVTTRSVEAGHCAFLSKPDEVVSFVEEAVDAMAKR